MEAKHEAKRQQPGARSQESEVWGQKSRVRAREPGPRSQEPGLANCNPFPEWATQRAYMEATLSGISPESRRLNARWPPFPPLKIGKTDQRSHLESTKLSKNRAKTNPSSPSKQSLDKVIGINQVDAFLGVISANYQTRGVTLFRIEEMLQWLSILQRLWARLREAMASKTNATPPTPPANTGGGSNKLLGVS